MKNLLTILALSLCVATQGQKLANNLNTTTAGYALDATQGKRLLDSITKLLEAIKQIRAEMAVTFSLRNAPGTGAGVLSILSPTDGVFKLFEFPGARVDTTKEKIIVTYPMAGGTALKEDVEPFVNTMPSLSFTGNVKESAIGSKVWKYTGGNGGGVSTRLFVPGIASSFEFVYKAGDRNVGFGLDTSASPLPLAGQAFSVYVTADEKAYIATDPKFLNYSISSAPVDGDTVVIEAKTDATLSAYYKRKGVKTTFHSWKDKLKVPMRLHISVAFDATGISAIRNPNFINQ